MCIYFNFDIYILNWTLSYGSQFPKQLNFKKQKTLENAIICPWPWVKYCSVERWSRWYQSFSKKIILKGTCPSLKLGNVWCDFSALEWPHGLKFRMKALFLRPNTMTEFFSILERFGKSRNNLWDPPLLMVTSTC